MTPDDDVSRRRYWSEQMDQAYGFMQRLLRYPVRDCCEPLCSLQESAENHGVPVVFPDGLKLGQFERVFWLRASLVDRLLRVADTMCRQGWLLKVEDAYRSLAVQRQGAHSDFIFDTVLKKVIWELGGAMPSEDLLLRRISVLTATTPKFANHMSGSAVDITVLTCKGRHEVDRGGSYLELSERTPMGSPFISLLARRHRDRINELLSEQGFLPYPYEFWHFSHGDADHALVSGADHPAVYGPVDCDLSSGTVTPVAASCRPLISLADIAARLAGRRGAARSVEAPSAEG